MICMENKRQGADGGVPRGGRGGGATLAVVALGTRGVQRRGRAVFLFLQRDIQSGAYACMQEERQAKCVM